MLEQQEKSDKTRISSAKRYASLDVNGAGINGHYIEDHRKGKTLQLKTLEAIKSFQPNHHNPVQLKSNNSGLPEKLKMGLEGLSGYAMDDVKVHYNSPKPAQLRAHAFAQGTDIHLAPGQEKHLPHEAWHVVQQKQGRVKPTVQLKRKIAINDDPGLEQEADHMGALAAQSDFSKNQNSVHSQITQTNLVQRFGAGTLKEVEEGTQFEKALQEYSELGGLIRFRLQPQLDGYRGTSEEKEITKELLDAKKRLITLRHLILHKRSSIKLASLDPYYKPLLEEIIEGRDHEDDVQKVSDPKRVGKEIEVPSVTIRSKEVKKNGVTLAVTKQKEIGLPVLKIETEGYDRGSPTIELIYGPLPFKEYQHLAYVNAKKKLFKVLGSAKGTFDQCISTYNSLLEGPEQRYQMRPTSAAASCAVRGKGVKTNMQTNVAVPFAAIGNTKPDAENPGVDRFFEGEKTKELFEIARDLANKMTTSIKAPPGTSLKNVKSLLTLIIYHDSMYGLNRMEKGKEKKKDKHHFHVMFKVSPEDAVISILSDVEALSLYEWVVHTKGEHILAGIKKSLEGTIGNKAKLGLQAGSLSIKSLHNSLKIRLLEGKQKLSKVSSDKRPVSTTELGAKVRHNLPRPSNRIPVMKDESGESHIVIEQRSSGHPLNQG